jgi:hypothetical protein
MNQMSRAQSRANSGTPAAINGDTLTEEIKPVSFSGKIQTEEAAARSENWPV